MFNLFKDSTNIYRAPTVLGMVPSTRDTEVNKTDMDPDSKSFQFFQKEKQIKRKQRTNTTARKRSEEDKDME